VQELMLTGGNLFDIANRFLGDATQWTIIASANGITDPWLNGMTTLVIPTPPNRLVSQIGQQ